MAYICHIIQKENILNRSDEIYEILRTYPRRITNAASRTFATELLLKMKNLAYDYKDALNVLKTVPELINSNYRWEILRVFPILNDQLNNMPGIRNRADFQPTHYSSFREDVENFGDFPDDAEIDNFEDRNGKW